jgi:hydrogenase-4 component E
MEGAHLVNILATLLIVTALFVVLARTPGRAALLYSLQSFVLVCTFLAIASVFHIAPLYRWAGTSFVTKTVLLPGILYFAFRRTDPSRLPPPLLNPAAMLMLAAVVVVVAAAVVGRVPLPLAADFKPVMIVSLSLIFLGLACIITQRDILKQIFGYCLMENGSHLALALLGHNAHELVEIGIGSDAIFAVIAMTFFATRIQTVLRTFDDRALMTLKD